MQEMDAEPGSAMQEYIMVINNCYPEEIVRWAPVPLRPAHPASGWVYAETHACTHAHIHTQGNTHFAGAWHVAQEAELVGW